MIEIVVNRHGRMCLCWYGQPVPCDRQRLREWVETHYERPWPPVIHPAGAEAQELLGILAGNAAQLA